MRLGLGLGISRAGKTGNYFPAAKTIITAIESRKGSAMTSAQRKAIDTFIRAETSAGRWGTSIKRFHVTGWGESSSNAYDWVAGGSGTFVNSPTMATGYFQGNGSNQYFDLGITPNALGLSNSSSLLGVLVNIAPTTEPAFFADAQTGATPIRVSAESSLLRGYSYGTAFASISLVKASQHGIMVSSRTSTTSNTLYRRSASGITQSTTEATPSTSANITSNIVFSARNNGGTISGYSNQGIGSMFAGVGMTDAQVTAFSLNLKTLWETLYGLTLP